MRLNRRSTIIRAAVVCAALSLTPFAYSQKKYGPGVTDTEIKIGNTYAYSGPASVYGLIGKTQAAYFEMLNDRGGINGRKIRFISLDDAFAPPKTVELTRRLVEQEEVLAIFGTLGTATNSAVQKYLNAKKVPHLFPGSGASKWNDPKNFPWTVGLVPDYPSEMALYAKHILATKPKGKIAVLYQNDDMGKEMLKSLKASLGPEGASMVVGEASYEVSDPSVDSQIVQLKATNADIFMHFSNARMSALTLRKIYDLGWKPTQYMVNGAASIKLTFAPVGVEKAAGVISMIYSKEPGDPAFAKDKGYQDYLAFLEKYMPGSDPTNSVHTAGYLWAQAMAAVLKACGDNLTRDNVIHQATNLKNVSLDILLPGITLNTTPEKHLAIRQMQLRSFDGNNGWKMIGGVVSID